MKKVPGLFKTLCCAKANSKDDSRFFGTDSQQLVRETRDLTAPLSPGVDEPRVM